MATKKRTNTISIRLNDDEKAQLKEWCGGMQMGRWIRNYLFDNQPAIPPAINRRQWQELARVGANLNQLAKRCNQGIELDIDEARQVLAEVREALIVAKEDMHERDGSDQEG